MTVERTNIYSGPFLGNGVTTQFPINFQAAGVDEVRVEVGRVAISRSLYTVSLLNDGTGSVTFFAAPVGTVVIFSDPLFTQEVDFEDQGPFYQSAVNEPIDRSALRDLVLLDGVNRSPRIPVDFADLLGLSPVVLPTGEWGFAAASGGGGGYVAPDFVGGTLAQMKSALTTLKAFYCNRSWYTWTLGDFSLTPAAQIDDIVVQSNSVPLAMGAWLRQTAADIKTARPGLAAAPYRPLQSKGRDVFSPLDCIPVSLHNAILAGTSLDPVGQYIKDALAGPSTDTMHFPRGKFCIEVPIDTIGRRLIGAGRDATKLVAVTVNMEAVLRVQGQNALIDGFYIDALYAQAGIKSTSSNGPVITRTCIDDAIVANILFPETGNVSAAEVRECTLRRGGRSRVCGTGTGSNGASSVTIAGADPTTFGIVPAYDFVYAAGWARPREITSFTASTISFFPPLEAAVAAGTPVKILSGANIRASRNGDASGIAIMHTTAQSAPLFGVDNSSLYGCQVTGGVYEYNGFAFGIGRRAGGGEQQPISASIVRPYAEANTYGAAIYHGSSLDFFWEHPMVDGVTQDGLDNMYVVDMATLRTSEVYIRGRRGRNRFFTTGTTDQIMGAGDNIVFAQQPTDYATPTITLIPPAAGSNAAVVASAFDLVATILLYLTGGKTFTLRSTAPIVGGSGPSGGYYSLSLGNVAGKKFECRWVNAFSSAGWVVTGG